MATGPLIAGSQLQVANFGDDKHAASPWSDAQVPSAQCGSVLGLNSMATPSAISMSQGNSFSDLWPAHRQSGGSRKNRNNRKRMNRSTRKQRGGAAAFPDVFGTTLDASLRASAGVDKIDAAFAQLPQFAGSYGTQTGPQVGGSRRNRKNRKNNAMRKNSRKNRKNSRKNNAMRKNSRKNNAMRKNSRKNRKNNAMRKNSRKNRKNSRRQRGGAWVDQFASVDAPSNLMPKDMYPYSHQNPQFYNENVVNPNFNGPSNSYAM